MKRVLDHCRRNICIGRVLNLHAAVCNDEGNKWLDAGTVARLQDGGHPSGNFRTAPTTECT